MNRKTLAILLLIVGIVCAAAAIALGRPGLALAAFVVFGFAASSLLSKAGRLADTISPLKGHRVHVSVWDNGIPGFAAREFQLGEKYVASGPNWSMIPGNDFRLLRGFSCPAVRFAGCPSLTLPASVADAEQE
jgi:hypothetical protein